MVQGTFKRDIFTGVRTLPVLNGCLATALCLTWLYLFVCLLLLFVVVAVGFVFGVVFCFFLVVFVCVFCCGFFRREKWA